MNYNNSHNRGSFNGSHMRGFNIPSDIDDQRQGVMFSGNYKEFVNK